jgi:hypothetical protein
MATLTVQTVSRSGLNPAYAAAAGGGDKFAPDKDTFLHVKNGSGGALTVVTPLTDPGSGQAISDVAVSVPAAGERMIGPFNASSFADPADGLASITYSGVTSLTVAAIKVQE